MEIWWGSWSKIGSQKVQKWLLEASERLQNGSLEVSGRLLASLGGLGAPKTDFSEICGILEGPIWGSKIDEKGIER